MSDYITDTFGPGGYLARAIGNTYEMRQGQVDLARSVNKSIHDKRHVLAEAPCGIGKGFAYAVPASFYASKKGATTVIATANIALQTQLINSDLPFLREALPWEFTYDLFKGRGNYACKHKIEMIDIDRDAGRFGAPGSESWQNYGLSPDDGKMLNALLAWVDVTETGDREDPGCPAGESPIWSRISVGPNDCMRSGCMHFGQCFAETHRERAGAANIIVTNYNLLYAHFKVLIESDGKAGVLPHFDYLVMDEAHEAAHIARNFFGTTLTFRSFRKVANFIESELNEEALAKQLTHDTRDVFVAAYDLTKTLPYQQIGRIPDIHNIDAAPLLATLTQTTKALETGALMTPKDKDKDSRSKLARIGKTKKSVNRLHAAINAAFCENQPNHVYWIDTKGDEKMASRIESRPLDVAPIMQGIFNNVPATMTSATLAVGTSFDHTKRELGLEEHDLIELVVESPFDFGANSRLVVGSRTLPVPRSENRPMYNRSVLPVYDEVLSIWPERALLLFTAKTDLEYVHEHLVKQGLNRRILKQGEWPRNTLVEWFKNDPTAILMGVDSFWTGVDVAAPKAVVLHKLPFPRMDIVTRAIKLQMKDTFFHDRYLPWMVTRLRQGIGRLIRRQDDYGFVVCLDRRAFDSTYAPMVRASLPFGPLWVRTDNMGQIEKFVSRRQVAA